MKHKFRYPVSDSVSKLVHDITRMGRSTIAWDELEITDADVQYAIEQYAKHGTDITVRLVPVIGEDGNETGEHEWIDSSDVYLRACARLLVVSEMLYDLHKPQVEDFDDSDADFDPVEYSVNYQHARNEIERYRQQDLENVTSAKHLYRLMTGELPGPELKEKLKQGLTPETIAHLESIAEQLGFDTSTLVNENETL